MSLCQKCGKNFDNGFQFCPHCGAPNSVSEIASHDQQEWEICEIEVFKLRKETIKDWLKEPYLVFCAIAIGPNGRYTAAQSEPLTTLMKHPFHTPDCAGDGVIFYDGAHKKFNNFINQLVKDGWQPTGKGNNWFSERFRRKVKKA